MVWNPYTKEEIAAMEKGLLTDEQRRAIEARLPAGPAQGDRCDFRIIMLLKPRLAVFELLYYRDRWLEWTATLVAEPARDAVSVLRDTIAVLERDAKEGRQ